MTTIKQMLERVESIQLREAVPVIIEDTKDEILRLNKLQLYNRGEDRNAQPLRLYGSLSYALEKNKMNPRPGFGRPDLFVTGQFYRGFNVKVSKNAFNVSSTDSKTPELVKKYSEDIFGLTPQSKTEYAKKVVYGRIKSHITAKSRLVFR